MLLTFRGASQEDVDTFAWWWALEHPFTQIAGALGVIDNLEQGAQAAIEDEDDAKLGFLGRTAAGFREVMVSSEISESIVPFYSNTLSSFRTLHLVPEPGRAHK